MDRAIEHPTFKVPILTWWKGIYDHVFVALHPFYRVRAEDAGPAGAPPAYEDRLGWDRRPKDFDDAIKARGESVSWDEVHRSVAPEEPRELVHRAIWLLSCVGLRPRANVALQERILDHCERQSLYMPFDDFMPPNLEPAIGRFLKGFGATSVTAWDEFRSYSTEIPLSDFDAARPSNRLPEGQTGSGVYGLHLPDPGVLLTWEFDCAQALVALSDFALRQCRPEEFFEGWYVDETTYSDVFNPRDFFLREA